MYIQHIGIHVDMKAIKQSINGFDTLLVSGNSHALIPAIVLINFSFWKNLIKYTLYCLVMD